MKRGGKTNKKRAAARKGQQDGLGRALINSKTKNRVRPGEGNHGPTKYNIPNSEVPIEDRLRSRTDDYTLGDFIADADLDGKAFQALHGKLRIVDRVQITVDAYDVLHKSPEQLEAEDRLKERLRIPRRPEWDKDTTPEELHERETMELIEWRKALAVVEETEHIVLSPFEKNPEVWKELWRVLERSQVAVYIIDGRDPLSFFCDDFVRYMNELKLPVLISINKADLVPYQIRKEWANYFDSIQDKLGFNYEFVTTVNYEVEGAVKPRDIVLKAKSLAKSVGRDGRVTVGFVGFPNVGKSSMLNSAVGRVCVRSSSTPGKTKHLQTINMEEDGITVCDCPGLVFPLFETSRAAMLTNGVLNIDQMTDWLSPVQIVVEKVPYEAFNILYGTKLQQGATANDLLQNLAKIRSFYTAHGNPDEARAARIVLKDYVNGKLIHCELPPGSVLKAEQEALKKEEVKEENIVVPDLPHQNNKQVVTNPNPKRRGVVRISTFE